MISFIVIGKNEGWKLTLCLASIINSINYNRLKNFEVIYVDSKSTDNSLSRALEFNFTKVIELLGECNSALARNIGAKESKGDILFFIDGDMEIEKEFISYAMIEDKLKYDCVTGHIQDYLYNSKDVFLNVKNRTYNDTLPINEIRLKLNGGIFLIKKHIWDSLNGMNTKFKRSQDFEFSIRLSKFGISIIQIPHLICIHHTVEYSNENRMWKNIKEKYYLYPALLFRNFITYPIMIKHVIRTNYTELFFLFFVLSIIFEINNYQYFGFFYLLLVLLRGLAYSIKTKTTKNKLLYLFERIIYQVIFDMLFWYSFLFSFPKAIKNNYKIIR